MGARRGAKRQPFLFRKLGVKEVEWSGCMYYVTLPHAQDLQHGESVVCRSVERMHEWQ